MIIDRQAVEDRSERIALFRAHIAVLFERLPMLCGFYVTQDLDVMEIAVHTWPGGMPSPREVNNAIRAALEDLLDGIEDDIDLLRGRTFARALH